MIDSRDTRARIEEVRGRIAVAAKRAGRQPGDVTLIAVTKTVSVERILGAIEAGITDLGENRVQEAEEKYSRIGNPWPHKVPRDGIQLHMIGTQQRNKARHAVRLFDYVHTLDRPELIEALERVTIEERPGHVLPVLVQVNYTGEEHKSGVQPAALPHLLEMAAGCKHIQPVGLMTIARLGAGETELRETFAGVRRLLDGLRSDFPAMRHLSMGMTDDYEIAVEEGATMVRIGRAIFGERPGD